MSRWFNIAGPCQEDIHYMLPPTTRLPDLEELIEQRSYFVVHAPRQTGKTTAMLALAQQLTESGRYAAVMVSVEVALAKEVVEKMVKDRSIPITREHILQAKEILIARQDTHLDSLAEKLREKRVRNIIEPILAGQTLGDTPNDDRQYLIDLGLLRRDPAGGLVITNPIYREVIPRALVQGTQDSLPHISPSWLTPEGELNKDALLEAFIRFWRQHGEPLLGSAVYHEIAPHLVLMAFLHRVVNGGGTLEREYAIGSDRMDLCLRYGSTTLGIELKVWREKKRDPQNEGIEQLESYLARLGLNEGWLLVFDRRQNALPIEERLSTQVVVTENKRSITVIRA